MAEEAERYRRCYEEERLLRLQRDREHEAEVDALRAEIAELRRALMGVVEPRTVKSRD